MIGCHLRGPLVATFLALSAADSPETFEALLREAREFVSIGNRSRASAAFRRAFLERPSESAPLLGLASIAEAAGDRDEAVLFFSAARACAPNDAKISADLARMDASPATGAASTVVVAYLGFAPAAGPGQVGSVPAGEGVRLDALLYQGIDENGRPVAIEPFFDVSPGLALEDRPRLSIAARGPSAGEWIAVGDANNGAIGRCDIRIVGSPEKISIRDSRRNSADAESIAVPPGDTVLLAASVSDAAGNRLFVPRLDWSAAAERPAGDVAISLAERHSLRPLAHFFEPHRNRIAIPNPDGAGAMPERIVVTASDPATRVAGRLSIVVDRAATPSLAARSPMPFFQGSYEEALAEARDRRSPVYAVVAAHW